MVTENEIGKLVAYYDEGWRHGYLEAIKPRRKLAIIKPIGAYGSNPRNVKIALADTKTEEARETVRETTIPARNRKRRKRN